MKCDRILFPIDFSDHNRALAIQVAWLANRFDSRVTLLHVADVPSSCGAATEAYYDWDTYEALANRTKHQLYEFPIDLPEPRVERAAMEGEPAYQIVNWATQHKIDLIVLGTHDCGTLRGLLLGSVAAKVIHEVSCPVWVHSTFHRSIDKQNLAVRNVICALELTEEAVPVLQFTNDFAEKLGANVLVIHSVLESEARLDECFDPHLHEYLMQGARSEISTRQHAAGTDFPVCVTREGISKAIVDAVRIQKADLVIVGRGKCRQMLGRLRTHEYDIIRQTPCPVLSYCCTYTEEEWGASPAEYQVQTA